MPAVLEFLPQRCTKFSTEIHKEYNLCETLCLSLCISVVKPFFIVSLQHATISRHYNEE